MATLHPIGEPTTDSERQALRYLAQNLPDDYTVYGSAWLALRSGVTHEYDAIVVAPHAIYTLTIKPCRGRVEGTDQDWSLPQILPSPLLLARKSAQALRAALAHRSTFAAQVWIESFVFLSATVDVAVTGPESRDRLHTRKTILAALQDTALLGRLSQDRATIRSAEAHPDLKALLENPGGPRPRRRVREYEILETLDHQEHYSEHLARHALSGADRLLRVFTVPADADEETRKRHEDRARWEATILARIGRCEGVLGAESPFLDDSAIVLPMDRFQGLSLPTWLQRYGPLAPKNPRADLPTRIALWLRIAATLDDVHAQGVVHRLLRPEVILVSNDPAAPEPRVTGFDLAKQLHGDATVYYSQLADERLRFAAPEVVSVFHDAQPASDQFSLGVLLSLLLCGRPLFESTRQLQSARRLLHSVSDLTPGVSRHLSQVVSRMVSLRPADRFPSLAEAIAAVRDEKDAQRGRALFPQARPVRDLDNLQPEDRLGNDYQIRGLLGQGGMAVVYAAAHLISGRTRALKIARTSPGAEQALIDEYNVLFGIDHPNIVRVIDINKIEDRVTMAMERVSGVTLRRYLQEHPDPDPHSKRRLAEDLLSALAYLEKHGITHKDLKPENLLVADGRLVVIDFSLARLSPETLSAGTPLYRDPHGDRFSHGTDRYAAALCLFELYAGRHAFEGRLPEPDQPPSVSEDDIDPPGLCRFFQQALSPLPEQRFPSAHALREALLRALGEDPQPQSAPPAAQPVPDLVNLIDARTPLRLSGLPVRAQNALLRGQQIQTVGQLLCLSEARVRAIHAIGSKTAADILAFQQALRARGVKPSPEDEQSQRLPGDAQREPPLCPGLLDSPLRDDRLQSLGLPAALTSALLARGLDTLGKVAALTRGELLSLPGVGAATVSRTVEALHLRLDGLSDRPRGASADAAVAHTLDRLWERASADLSPQQRQILERTYGLVDDPEPQGEIARDLGRSQSQVSNELSRGLGALAAPVIGGLLQTLDLYLDSAAGLVLLADAGQRFEEQWPAGVVRGAGIVRLLCKVSAGACHLLQDIEGARGPVLARPAFDRETLRAFCAAVHELARRWPPHEAEGARRTLKGILPHYSADPLALAMRLCPDVQASAAGQLFLTPVDTLEAIKLVIERAEGSFPLADLSRRVEDLFGVHVSQPDPDDVLRVLREQGCQVQGELILLSSGASVLAPPPPVSAVMSSPMLPAPDAPVGQHRSADQVVRDLLLEAQGSRGFRMVVAPPERHGEIARSVAAVLGGRYLSYEDAFFQDHEAQLPALERAERFPSQREALTEAAEHTLFRLLDEHGQRGQTLVLGDTALWGLCDALDLPRRLYDQTLSGAAGFWVVVVPGFIDQRQPRWNEGPPLWHLAGATLALGRPL